MSNRYLQGADHLDKAADSLVEARKLLWPKAAVDRYEDVVGSLIEAIALLQEELEEVDQLAKEYYEESQELFDKNATLREQLEEKDALILDLQRQVDIMQDDI